MTLKLTPRFILAFMTCTFVLHEAHELAHTSVGRLICGCWGLRDFNTWQLCDGCGEQKSYAVIATFAGPLFTYIMMWAGALLTGKNKTAVQNAVGFSLIFSNKPFARIFTAAMGGGDEVSGLNVLLKNHMHAWVIGLTVVILITIIPLYKAFKLIENKYRAGWFLLFLIGPMLIEWVVIFGLMNSLLKQSILSNYWILGSPVLVTVWTMLTLIVFMLTRKGIYTFNADHPKQLTGLLAIT